MRFAATAMALALLAPPLPAADEMVLRYDDDRLTVRLDAVPLDQVIAALVDETGVQLRGEPPDRRQVTKQFEALPLPEALDRLFGRQNFALRYGRDGRPQTLRLYGGAASDAPPQSAGPGQPGVKGTAPNTHAVLQSPMRQDLLDGEDTQPARLVRAAVQSRDPSARAAARAALVDLVNGDAAIRKALRRISADTMATELRGWPTAPTGALLLELARRVQDRRIRDMFLQTHLRMLRHRLTRPSLRHG